MDGLIDTAFFTVTCSRKKKKKHNKTKQKTSISGKFIIPFTYIWVGAGKGRECALSHLLTWSSQKNQHTDRQTEQQMDGRSYFFRVASSRSKSWRVVDENGWSETQKQREKQRTIKYSSTDYFLYIEPKGKKQGRDELSNLSYNDKDEMRWDEMRCYHLHACSFHSIFIRHCPTTRRTNGWVGLIYVKWMSKVDFSPHC